MYATPIVRFVSQLQKHNLVNDAFPNHRGEISSNLPRILGGTFEWQFSFFFFLDEGRFEKDLLSRTSKFRGPPRGCTRKVRRRGNVSFLNRGPRKS